MLKLTKEEISQEYPDVPEDLLNRVIRVGKNLDMTPEETRKFLELVQTLESDKNFYPTPIGTQNK